jgi:hypothetical protein
MKAIDRRLCRLERRFAPPYGSHHRIRIMLRAVGPDRGIEAETLESAKCSRTLWPNGTLFEIVRLKGSKHDRGRMSNEELDRWVESFPTRHFLERPGPRTIS